MSESETIKVQKRVHPSRFRLGESARNVWSVIPEVGTTLEDVLSPDYWSHNASKLRPLDRIEVDAEDGSWTATLLVRSVSRLAAVVTMLFHLELDPEDAVPESDEFHIMWKGPMHKHSVVRSADQKTIIQGGFDTKDAARAWLASNSRSLAA